MAPDRFRSLIGMALLVSVGVALVALQVATVLGTPSTLFRSVLASLIPVTLALTVFVGGVGIYYYDLDEFALRIGGWTCFGVVAFVIAGSTAFSYFTMRGLRLSGLDIQIGAINLAASGAVLGFLIGLYDARRIRLTRQLRSENERVTMLYQRMSVLNRVLRHDLRNQMNLVLGNAAVLAERDDPDVADLARDIHTAGYRLLTLSDRTRRLVDPEGLEASTREIDLVSVTREVLESVVGPADDVDVRADFPEEAPVVVTPSFGLAIRELVENCLEHNDAASPRIAVSISSVAGRPEVELRIADNGPGIPDRELRVLEADTETELQHSSGLGLWIVKWLVDASGGSVQFDAAEEGGTEIRIRVPTDG